MGGRGLGIGWGKIDLGAGAVVLGLRFRFLPVLLVVGVGLGLVRRCGRVTIKGEEESSRPMIPLPEQLGSRRREVIVFQGAV